MPKKNLLENRRILIVDDEPDVLDVLQELLHMCHIEKELLETHYFDLAILDIMGVEGYELLKIANEKDVIGVMLTAHAMTPEHVEKSYQEGAGSFVPKEEIGRIEVFLNDILEAKAKGKSLWWRWFDRFADYFERKFGPEWQKKHGITVK